MTVGYMKEVATVSTFTFSRLLAHWRGSIWRGITRELMLWLVLYNIISLIYRIVLFGTSYGRTFENCVKIVDTYLKNYGSTLNFVAAFYMSYVSARWWNLFMQIPWPDTLCMHISALMNSNGPVAQAKERQIRLLLCKYWNLAFVLLMRKISVPTRKRFPTLDHLCPEFASAEELNLLRETEDHLHTGSDVARYKRPCMYFLPLNWMHSVIKRAAAQGNFIAIHVPDIHEEIERNRQMLFKLLAQDSVFALPASLTQIVLLAPIVYFTMCLVGKQYIVEPYKHADLDYTVDYVVPLYTIYEFLIYVAWIKAAMSMLNPFGLGQDDFEVEYLVERNKKYSRVLLDDLYESTPKVRDFVFHDLASKSKGKPRGARPLVGSAANINVSQLPDALLTPSQISTPCAVHQMKPEEFPAKTLRKSDEEKRLLEKIKL